MPRSADDWDYLLTTTSGEFWYHEANYPKRSTRYDVTPYIEAMEIYASDRDKAIKYSQEAQAEGNPYYFNEFMKLAELIQETGNQKAVNNGATSLLTWDSRFGERHWWSLCWILRNYGRPLYRGALINRFDENLVRESARILVTRSLDQLENGYQYLPSELWNTAPDGTVKKEADVGLGWVETVREEAEYFKLTSEHSRATDLMNRYLKATLCLLSNGHQWYHNLSTKHSLSDARNYIEGFYATLFGKVEIDTGEEKLPAAEAKVTVTDPHDKRTWETETDQEGRYKIEDVILHEQCSPFNIFAEYHSDQVESQYIGPLTEPDPSAEHEKNLLFALPEYTAILKTIHQSRSQNDYSDETRDYTVYLKLELRATTPPPSQYSMLKQNNVEISSISVESYQGKITLVEGPPAEKETKTWVLEKADYLDPRSMDSVDVPWMSTYHWNEEGLIKSVIFPALSVKLDWSGPPSGGCPSRVIVGPVSDSERSESDSDRVVGELKNTLGSMGLGSGGSFDMSKMGDMMSAMSSIGDLLGGVLDMATHQDYTVTSGDGVSFFGGGGRKEVEDRGQDSYMKEVDIFSWEIKRIKRPHR